MQPVSERRGGGIAPRDSRNLWVQTESILAVSRVVSNLGRAETFYRSALGFKKVSSGPVDPELLRVLGVPDRTAHEVRLRLGQEDLVLVAFESAGREYPPDSRSNDLWFQHLAIVVSDIDRGYERLRASDDWRPISTHGPMTLPPSSGGVRAFKFRDPDGHPLELLWLPESHGRREWQDRFRAPAADGLFLGIDHSALAVRSTRRSLAFYGSLGLHVVSRSMNRGPAQSRLDGLGSTSVRVTALRPASAGGPGLELLAYRPAGRPRETSAVPDLSTDWTTLAAVMAGANPGPRHDPDRQRLPAPLTKSLAVTDPDGHRFVLVSQ